MNHYPQIYLLPYRGVFRLRWRIFQWVILIVLLGWLYFPILSRLVRQWFDDPDYSHGFLVPAFSIFMLWRERSHLSRLTAKPSAWGLLILVMAESMLIVGVLGAELFLSRISLLFVMAGLVVFFFGWQCFRSIFFPWAFLFLMVPIPAILMTRVTFPLQILASTVAGSTLPLMGVPVLREGNIINLPAMSLEVAEACSGIHSLLSLITLAIIYGFLTERRTHLRFVLALASIPIAVAANSLRIVITGLVAQYWDPSKAQGFFHEFSGWLLFLISLAVLVALHRFLRLGEVRSSVGQL